MDGIERLKQLHEQKAQKAEADSKHQQSLVSNVELQETVVRSFKALVNYLENSVSKTAVVNQLRSIGTPDALKVAEAVDNLHETLKTHKNTDLTEITGVMREVLAEAKALPKKHPEPLEIPHIDYSTQFELLTNTVKTVQAAIENKNLNVEAPVINLPEPKVTVEATNYGPMKEWLGEIREAVQAIVIPKTDLDTSKVETLLDKQHKTLEKILAKPTGGGGGGGSSWVAVNSEGTPMPIELTGEGAVPTTSPPLATRIDDVTTADTTYIGKAAIATATSAAAWQIAKLDTSSGLIKTWADGSASFSKIWDDRVSISYS